MVKRFLTNPYLKMKRSILIALGTISLFAAGCHDIPVPGCTDPNAENYNVYATESNGTCKYRYAGNVKVSNFSSNNSAGNSWDLADGPDLYLVFSKTSSSTWDYSTSTVPDVQGYAELTNTSTNIRFTNESWKYELRDDDGSGLYEVVSSGTFNPMQDRHASEVTLSIGSTTIYFTFSVN
jgi:hypothetical protein